MQFSNRTHLQALRADLAVAVKAVSERHGISIQVGKITYMDSSCTVKLECAAIAADGAVQTKESEAFRMMAHLYDLKAEDLGRTFSTPQGTYTICGLKPSAPKFPILAKAQDGKTYKFPERIVVAALARQ